MMDALTGVLMLGWSSTMVFAVVSRLASSAADGPSER